MYMTLGHYIKTMNIGQSYDERWIGRTVRRGEFDVNGHITNDVNYPLECGDIICRKVGKNRSKWMVGPEGSKC